MATQSNDLEGTREHLTAAQTRILYKLWQRFFRLCDSDSGYATVGTTDTALTSANTSVPNSGDGNLPTPASSSGAATGTGTAGTGTGTGDGKQAGPSTPANELDDVSNQSQQPSHRNTSPNGQLYQNGAASTSYSYSGKPVQRHPSRSRQIDERGSHIPKDDKVKDELKTIEEAKEMKEFLERYGGGKLREIFWDMVKGEHPDAVMLRFLRARKWDIDRAIAVIGSTAAFRADNDVRSIVKGGELEFTRTRGATKILVNGISYVYGATAVGEPIYFIEVGNHFSHNQTQEELKRGIILIQEWLQMLMPPPIEKKVVIFNMNDFGIRNMDWWTVFFMVKTMESYYVETLAKVYVHNPPWIFRPIWAILKPLLDPVVRDKIRLTSTPEELAEHIPLDHLPKGTMRGEMDWEFEFTMPEEGDNDIQKDTNSFRKYDSQYQGYARDFESATMEICRLYSRSSLMARARDGGFSSTSETDEDGLDDSKRYNRHSNMRPKVPRDTSNTGSIRIDEMGSDLKAKRDVIATRLRVSFLKLKPYIVGKGMHHRWNVLRDDGSIQWEYPKLDGSVETQLLGQGTTLPKLERNLAMIDEAAQLQQQLQRDSSISKRDESKKSSAMERQGSKPKAAMNGVVKPSFDVAKDENLLLSDTPVIARLSSDKSPNTNSSDSNAASHSTVTPGSITTVEGITEGFSAIKSTDQSSPEPISSSEPMPIHPFKDFKGI